MNCGSPLAPASGLRAGPAALPGTAVPYGAAYPADTARMRDADRTKTGAFLLLLGALLGWVPYLIVILIAFIVFLVGAILVLVGRRSFGRIHSRNAIASVLLLVFGIAANLAVYSMFLATIGSVPQGAPMSTVIAILTAALDNYVLGLIVVGAISGLASVLFTLALQRSLGKAILWTGYGVTIGLYVAIYVIITPLVGPALNDATASGTFDPAPLNALLDRITTLSYLGVIAAALFAAANFLAWSRIHRGEIPEKLPMPTGTVLGPAPPSQP